MKRIWMFVGIVAMPLASIPVQGWMQNGTVRVFTRGTETITVKEVTPNGFTAGVGRTLVVNGIIYAGTTDYLWISKDTGKTWVKRGRESGLEAWIGWVKALAAADSGHILAGAGNGIFKSTNNGETWRHVFWAPPYGRIASFVVAQNGTIFAAQDRIFRSVDNGNTWQEVADSVWTWPYVWRMTQTVKGTILAGISSSGPTAGRGVLRSTDGGDSWFLTDSGFTDLKNIEGLAATPQKVYAAIYRNGAWQSDDDGISWKRVDGIPVMPAYSTAACSIGVFFGFDRRGTSDNALWRLYPEGWEPIPGFTGFAVEGITSFDEKTVVVCGTGKIFLVRFDTITGVEEEETIPPSFALHQNYPNPFNPSTTISFSLPERSYVRLTVYNMLGQEVATLVAEEMSAGTHRITWNASGVPSGVYFARLESQSIDVRRQYIGVRKMVLLR